MSGISAFIHYHILRKLCDSQINEQNNIGIVTLKDIIDYYNNKPDIETGLNKPFIIQTVKKSETEFKGPEYWV